MCLSTGPFWVRINLLGFPLQHTVRLSLFTKERLHGYAYRVFVCVWVGVCRIEVDCTFLWVGCSACTAQATVWHSRLPS